MHHSKMGPTKQISILALAAFFALTCCGVQAVSMLGRSDLKKSLLDRPPGLKRHLAVEQSIFEAEIKPSLPLFLGLCCCLVYILIIFSTIFSPLGSVVLSVSSRPDLGTQDWMPKALFEHAKQMAKDLISATHAFLTPYVDQWTLEGAKQMKQAEQIVASNPALVQRISEALNSTNITAIDEIKREMGLTDVPGSVILLISSMLFLYLMFAAVLAHNHRLC
jgi:hypothetical protein